MKLMRIMILGDLFFFLRTMTDFTYQSHLENKSLFRKLDIEGQGGVRTPGTP